MKRLLLLALPACLSVPDEEKPMCAVTEDCDHANGEICDDGICWGNPPDGMFSAIVSPPASRTTTLASQELTTIVINDDGWIDQLQLEKPLEYVARLTCQAPLACDDTMLAATITITRPSTFPGGPGFRSVVKTTNGDAFKILVPPNDGYAATTYTVTIVPEGRDAMGSSTTPAQLLPPLRTQLTIDANATGKVIELGGANLPTISGTIRDDAGQPQSNYRVVAIGKWEHASAPSEVSTVDFTGSDGTFSIQLSGGLTPRIELVARPVGTTNGGTVRPTLRYAAEVAQSGVQGLSLQWPPAVGGAMNVAIPVQEVSSNGPVKPLRGARVIVSAAAPIGNGKATFVAEATTDGDGIARLAVLDGAAFSNSYRISVVPPASSTSSVLHDQPFSYMGPIPPRVLKTRVPIRGFVQIGGNGVKDMAITARPALRFLWSVDPDRQAFLAAIPPSTTTTPESGEFVVWVDPEIANVPAYYDLVLEAGTDSRAPNLVIPGVRAPDAGTKEGDFATHIYDLPSPAYVRSRVVDDKGNALEGADLKLFKVEDFSNLCGEVAYPPMSCATASTLATLMGRGSADGDGEVRLTLPR